MLLAYIFLQVGNAFIFFVIQATLLTWLSSRCAPCRQFTPILAKFYEEMKRQGKKLEIVWVSRDQTSEDFVQYFSKMPWLAVPMQNVQAVNQKLAPKYQVKGIPHLVFLDARTGEVISLDGRGKVLKDPYGLEFPWRGRSIINLVPFSIREAIRSQFYRTWQKIFGTVWKLIKGFFPGKFSSKNSN